MSIITVFADRVADRLIPVIEKLGDTLIDKSLAMIAAELPQIAAAVAEAAIKTTFDNTHIDEAANEVSDVITGILDRLRILR